MRPPLSARMSRVKNTIVSRVRAVALADAGWSLARIAKDVQKSKRTVGSWIRTFRATGRYEDAPRSGRPKNVTPTVIFFFFFFFFLFFFLVIAKMSKNKRFRGNRKVSDMLKARGMDVSNARADQQQS